MPASHEVTSLSLWTWSLGGRSAVLILGILNLVVVARALGPHGRGQLFLFGSIVFVLATIADIGLTQTALAFGGRSDVAAASVHRALLRRLLLSSLVTCAAAALLLGLTGPALVPNIPEGWLMGATIAVPAALYVSCWSALMVSLRRAPVVTAVQIGAGLLTLIANLLLVATTGDVGLAVVIYVVSLLAQATTMVILRPRSDANGDSSVPATGVLGTEMLLFGLRGYPNSLGSLLWTRSAAFLLNALHGPEAVGVYSVAQQLAERALLPVQSFQDVLYNRMIRLAKDDAVEHLNRLMRIVVALMVPTLIVASLMSQPITTALFSESFGRAADVLRLMLIGSAATVAPALIATYVLAQRRRPGLLSILSWAIGLLTVSLLIGLVPRNAEMGAALATVIPQILGAAVVVGVYLRTTRTSAGAALIPRRADFAVVLEQVRAIGRPPTV